MILRFHGTIEIKDYGVATALFLGTDIPLLAEITRRIPSKGTCSLTAKIAACSLKQVQGEYRVEITLRTTGEARSGWESWFDEVFTVGSKDVVALLRAAVGRRAEIRIEVS